MISKKVRFLTDFYTEQGVQCLMINLSQEIEKGTANVIIYFNFETIVRGLMACF